MEITSTFLSHESKRKREREIISARNGGHLILRESSYDRITSTRTSKEKQLQEYIIKFEGKTNVSVRVCVCSCMHLWKRARMKTIHHRTGEVVLTPRFSGDGVKGHNAATGPGAGRQDLVPQLCHSSASSGTCLSHTVFYSPNGALTGPVWDLSNKEMWKCFGNICTNINGHYYPFIPMPRRATFDWANVPHKWHLFWSQAAFRNRRRDANNFPERQWCFFFNFSIISKTIKAKLFPSPFVFPNKNKL